MGADLRQGDEVVEAEHAEAGGALEQQVQQVGGGQRVVEGAVRGPVVEPEAVASVPSRQSGTSSRTSRRASGSVSTTVLAKRLVPVALERAR